MAGKTRNQISDDTGFDLGERFDSEREVRDYFTPKSQLSMFGDDAIVDETILAAYAEAVISNRWHMLND